MLHQPQRVVPPPGMVFVPQAALGKALVPAEPVTVCIRKAIAAWEATFVHFHVCFTNPNCVRDVGIGGSLGLKRCLAVSSQL